MKVIDSTYRHRNWRAGFRCILEFRNASYHDSRLALTWLAALRQRFGDHFETPRAERQWIREYFRSTCRIYLRDPSLVTMMLLIDPELRIK